MRQSDPKSIQALRKIRDRQAKETRGMSASERIEYLRKKAERVVPPKVKSRSRVQRSRIPHDPRRGEVPAVLWEADLVMVLVS